MPLVAIDTYLPFMLTPHRNAHLAVMVSVPMAEGSYAKGQCLGEIAAAAAEVQTITITGTPTGGTAVLTATSPKTGATFDFTINFDDTAAEVKTAMLAAITELVTADITTAGGTLPGTAVTVTFVTAGYWGGSNVPMITLKTNSLTGGSAPTVTMTQTTAHSRAGDHGAYLEAATDGRNIMRGVLAATVVVDANHVVTFADGTGNGMDGAPMFEPGHGVGFLISQLVGIDANGLADVQGFMAHKAVTDSDGIAII